jgi:polysaccharide pyruvyl transferase WcaK-like protein/MoaA/NifB/PqqE/SkfB family radical SAM enzyme
VAGRLKAISYLIKRKPYRLERPVVLQLPVIDICNSRCQMCRIWENKKSDDLTPDQLRKGLRNPLFAAVGGVGLNGGEPTLRKDLGEIAHVLYEELPSLRSISLITNGYKVEEVIERVREVGEAVRKHAGTLDVMVSIDGHGDVHDRVRGKPGNFERAREVLGYLKSSELVTSVRIGCTIIKENVYGLHDLLEYSIAEDVYIKYRLGIPHQRLYTAALEDPYALSAAEKFHVAEFLEGLIAHYETSESQKFFYRSLVDQLVHGKARRAGCDWQHRGATVTSKGELLYCAVQSKPLAKIHEADAAQAYFANEPHLREIISSKCASCHHDYVGIPPKPEYFKQLALDTLRRMGLEDVARAAYARSGMAHWDARRAFLRRQKGLASVPLVTPPPVATTRRPGVVRVLICGWYGTETVGDKAILAGIIAALRRQLSTVEITLVSVFPYVSEMSRRQMGELKGCRIVTPADALTAVSQTDLVAFGGGPLMAIDELADMEAIFRAAKQAGVPTLIAGCGVGPLGATWHDAALKRILELASVRIFRDEESRALAGKLGVDVAADAVAEDPAFTWLESCKDSIPRVLPRRPTLVLGLRDFPYRSYGRHLSTREGEQASRRQEAAVLEALEVLVAQCPELLIKPLPMCTNHFGGDDRWHYRRMFRGNGKLAANLDLSLLGPELTPIEYCRAYRSATVALTMRFHALVFAIGLGVPAVAIDYTLGQGKVQALARRFSVPFQSLTELDSGFIVAEVTRHLTATDTPRLPVQPHFEDALAQALPRLGFA